MSMVRFCDGCGKDEAHWNSENERFTGYGEEIMDVVGYPKEEYDLCPDCGKWLYDHVRELVENKIEGNVEQ